MLKRISGLIVVLTAVGIGVTGCGTPAEPTLQRTYKPLSLQELREAKAEERAAAEEKRRADAGLIVQPGSATCTFNNVPEGATDGAVTTLGHLDTAQVQETADAYVVTFTGDFFDRSTRLTSDSILTLSVAFDGPEGAGTRTLTTLYYEGDLSFTGAHGDAGSKEEPLRTDASLRNGKFTATYPKSSANLAGFTPTTWEPSVSVMGAPSSDGAGHPLQFFRCGDGQSWEWLPAAGATG
ncbi:hypothetical protein J2Y69_003418 [Microbacterium resistens]|uniref:Lipoprotein n=1 Tax=Microbacterium resistens TaxID=156977 RepID=A0ABU1SGP3_9MICO|nr:hypothetical protein [Microbacterium resistens]MDR6868794.1 hypothetical protein [Microbacterium resistens]